MLLHYVRRFPVLTALLILFFCWAGLLIALAQTITRYVSTTGTNTDPATSWATSTTDLQGAIDASAFGDAVWLHQGIYKSRGNANTDRSISFAMKNGVAIYGGFGGIEASLNDPPPLTLSRANPVAPLNSVTVQGTGIPIVQVPSLRPPVVMQASGGVLYERVIIMDRINGYGSGRWI